MIFFNNLPLLFTPPSGTENSQGGGAVTLITFGLVFVVFYFLIIRPQSKRQKQTKDMLSKLKKGDKVVTIGGIRGIVKSLTPDAIVIKVSADSTLELNRSAIASIVDSEGGSNKPVKAVPTKDKGTEKDSSAKKDSPAKEDKS